MIRANLTFTNRPARLSIIRIKSIMCLLFHIIKSIIQIKVRNEYLPRFYHSSIDKCECGENLIISSIIDIDVPCSHRVFLDAIFPPLRPQHITIKPQWINLDFEFSIINDESPPEDYHDEV